MLPPGALSEGTSPAATGSVTAVKTIGMSLVAASAAWADGVEIGTMTVTASPTNCLAICAAVAGVALGRLVDESRFPRRR